MDLYLDPSTHTLATASGRLQTVTGLRLIAQRIRIRLRRHLGEYVLDTRKGVDYRGLMTRRPVDLAAIVAVFRDEVSSALGVIRLQDVATSLERATGTVRLTATIVTTEGDIAATLSPYSLYEAGGILLLSGASGAIL